MGSSRSRRRPPRTSRRCSASTATKATSSIFKILKRGEHEASGQADLALRYDLTVPLARVVAEYQSKLPRFFKRYQIQPVWRADRPARGRFREFYQCDIDAIGSTSPVVEAEQIAAVRAMSRRLGFDDFSIRLNHRRFIAALAEQDSGPGRPSRRRARHHRQARQGRQGRRGKGVGEQKGFSRRRRSIGITRWICAGAIRREWLDSIAAESSRRSRRAPAL